MQLENVFSFVYRWGRGGGKGRRGNGGKKERKNEGKVVNNSNSKTI